MKGLILLYWGTVFLMYLSQTYYPAETQLDGLQTGKRHFLLRRADIFMIIVITWMTCFSFFRTSYNDTIILKNSRLLTPGWLGGVPSAWYVCISPLCRFGSENL